MTPEAQRIAIAEGVVIGRLTVLGKARQNKQRNWLWACRCECGNTKEVLGSDLARQHTISCGCFRRDTTIKNKTSHGGARRGQHAREYRIWRGMINRCELPTNPAYADYGGRGIAVCPEWRASFEVFRADMGDCPPSMTIDRIKNDLGYSKDNCRWATSLQQAQNRRPRRWKKKPLTS